MRAPPQLPLFVMLAVQVVKVEFINDMSHFLGMVCIRLVSGEVSSFVDFESALNDFQKVRVILLAVILMYRLVEHSTPKPTLSKTAALHWLTRTCAIVACIMERFRVRPRLLTAVVIEKAVRRDLICD